MAIQFDKIFTVIDPSTDEQRALTRALHIAERTNAAVHAYLCCYSSLKTNNVQALQRAEIARHELWLEQIIASANLGGIDITTQVEWSEDWRETLARAAAEYDCDLIVKAASQHSTPGRYLLKTADWAVLRNAQCPVLLIKRDSVAPVQRVLIAVNPKVEDAQHRQLNEDIISIGKQITEGADNSELHAVCAYDGKEPITFAPELARLVSIDESRAHSASGSADDVIVDCATLLESELVVVGTVSRSGLSGVTRGNTAERALDRLATDVLVTTAA
jgi:universal stress protein E